MVSTRDKIVRVSACLVIALCGCKPDHEPEFPYGVDESAGGPSERVESPTPPRRGAAGPQRLEFRPSGDPAVRSEDAAAPIRAELDGPQGSDARQVDGPDGTMDIEKPDETPDVGTTPHDAGTEPSPRANDGGAVVSAPPVPVQPAPGGLAGSHFSAWRDRQIQADTVEGLVRWEFRASGFFTKKLVRDDGARVLWEGTYRKKEAAISLRYNETNVRVDGSRQSNRDQVLDVSLLLSEEEGLLLDGVAYRLSQPLERKND